MKEKIKILYFYPELLNLYGDRGNIEVFLKRCEDRDLKIELITVGVILLQALSRVEANEVGVLAVLIYHNSPKPQGLILTLFFCL